MHFTASLYALPDATGTRLCEPFVLQQHIHQDHGPSLGDFRVAQALQRSGIERLKSAKKLKEGQERGKMLKGFWIWTYQRLQHKIWAERFSQCHRAATSNGVPRNIQMPQALVKRKLLAQKDDLR